MMLGTQMVRLDIADRKVEVPAKVMRRVRRLMLRQRRIDAVLAIKHATGLDLSTAKLIVEHPEQAVAAEPPPSAGLWGDLRAVIHGRLTTQQWMQRHRLGMVGAVAGAWIIPVVLILSGLFQPAATRAASNQVWYYDLGTGELFAQTARMPPIDAPSGPFRGRPGGVRAYVFTCGQCSPSETFIGWLEVFTPDAAQALDLFVTEGAEDESKAWQRIGAGHMIRRADDQHWVRADSREAAQIQRQADHRCGSQGARPCYP